MVDSRFDGEKEEVMIFVRKGRNRMYMRIENVYSRMGRVNQD